MTPIVIVLTDAEVGIAKWIARKRYESNRTAGVVDAKVGPQSTTETDEIGVGAEIAFCKLCNVYPDLEVRPRRGSADCVRFGESVDVKATRYANGKLLAVRRKAVLAADVYALLIVEWPKFRFAGFARGADLLRPERLLQSGVGYAIPQSELTYDQIPWGVR